MRHEQIALIDVRERGPYNFIHLDGALNIPASELTIRGPHEIDKSKPLLVFCNFFSFLPSKWHRESLQPGLRCAERDWNI